MFKNINPVIKLGCNVIGVILAFLTFSVNGLLALLIFTILLSIVEGNLTKKSLLKISPLALFGVGIFLSNFLWGTGDFKDSLSHANFMLALVPFLRILIIGTLAMSFLFNIEPNKMLMSLIQNLKLNPGIAYGVMVAFRFFPMMQRDLVIIKHARNIRLMGDTRSFKDKLTLPLPILAINIRRAERVAIAMEGRGFSRFSKRTYYTKAPLKMVDFIYLLVILLVFIGIYYFGHGESEFFKYTI